MKFFLFLGLVILFRWNIFEHVAGQIPLFMPMPLPLLGAVPAQPFKPTETSDSSDNIADDYVVAEKLEAGAHKAFAKMADISSGASSIGDGSLAQENEQVRERPRPRSANPPGADVTPKDVPRENVAMGEDPSNEGVTEAPTSSKRPRVIIKNRIGRHQGPDHPWRRGFRYSLPYLSSSSPRPYRRYVTKRPT